MEKFIDAEMFTSLVGCVAIVVAIVQLAKHKVKVDPLTLNLIATLVVTLTRIWFVGDFSTNGIMLGLYNFIPIALGSAGAYDFATNLLDKKKDA